MVCDLCPHMCRIAVGNFGRCRVRRATNEGIDATGYGQMSSVGIDPIEKKPLYHFLPGTTIFSIGGWGCNMSCSFCQNWSISQRGVGDGHKFTPNETVEHAIRSKSIGIAYTYNEPIINFEFVLDCAKLASDAGLANVLVTNGYICPEPAAELIPYMNAINIDIKSMDNSFYKTHCGASLKPVLDFAVQAFRAGCHVELTNLLIPDLNDSANIVRDMANWISSELSVDTVLHLSAYHPQYKLRKPPTSIETLKQAFDICSKTLHYVYLGNIYSDDGQSTWCPNCGNLLVARRGYTTEIRGIDSSGRCATCGALTNIVMNIDQQRTG
ncbi:MAG: AmmeMemoRadiSam system radical SAM enzyme [Lentisphaerae bacterium]|nr:AmmeMemoRadiSam system radical SAM enzyme [Lentisphaerota bacterium]